MAGALAKKMLAVMAAVDAVEKRGKNEKQGYAYVKAVDVAREVRKALMEVGVGFSYDCGQTERWEKPTNSGGSLTFVQLPINATFTDIETGEEKTITAVGWGMDTGDKAIYKAMTGALKYALRMNFLIPDELDPENDAGEQTARQEVVRASSKPKTAERVPFIDAEPQEIDEPVFDEAGEQVPVPNKGTISPKQVARFWAIALKGGKSKVQISEILGKAGLARIEDCPWGDLYDKLIVWAQTK
jgi:hypothetical protein